MTRRPDFDELVGAEVAGEERERLRRVHDLLLEAEPPPELSPQLEGGPTLAMTLGRPRRRRVRRRLLLLAAALAALALAAYGGYLAGSGGGGGLAGDRIVTLHGTSAAPQALASLRVEPADAAGNWPMVLSVTGLPKLPAHGYYEVYVTRNGKPWASCGVFAVASTQGGVEVTLNAPYELRPGDTWIVTRHLPGGPDPGTVVLSPRV